MGVKIALPIVDAVNKVRSGTQVGLVATSPVLFGGGSPTLQSGRQNQRWARLPDCLHHPCRLGDPQRFNAGSKFRSGTQVGVVASSPLPSVGLPSASKRGTKTEMAHN